LGEENKPKPTPSKVSKKSRKTIDVVGERKINDAQNNPIFTKAEKI
jgi:hypothetical protein